MLRRAIGRLPRNQWIENGAEVVMLIFVLVYKNSALITRVSNAFADKQTPSAGDISWAILIIVFVALFLLNESRIMLGVMFFVILCVLAFFDLGLGTHMTAQVNPQTGLTIFWALGWGTFLFLIPTFLGFVAHLLSKDEDEGDEVVESEVVERNPTPPVRESSSGSRLLRAAVVILFLAAVVAGLNRYYNFSTRIRIPYPALMTARLPQSNATQTSQLLVELPKAVNTPQVRLVQPTHETSPTQSPPCSVKITLKGPFWIAESPSCFVGKVEWAADLNSGAWHVMDRSGEWLVSEPKDGLPAGQVCFRLSGNRIYCAEKVAASNTYTFFQQ